MEFLTDNLVTVTLLVPLVGAIVVGLLTESDDSARWVALGASVLALVSSLWLLVGFDPAAGTQAVDSLAWIPTLGSSLTLGVDGISLVLVLLTTFLMPLIVVAAWDHGDRIKGYLAAFLALEAAVIGVFTAQDLLVFYVFFEFTLVPMYFIIGIWGGANRRYAAVKFFLYTLLGGLTMLAAILYLYTAGGATSFAYPDLLQAATSLSLVEQRWLFLAFFVGFAVKVPLFPVHTWLPDAHTEAPTAGSVFLAAIMLKMGGYGFIRYCLTLFPDASRELSLGTGSGFFAVPWMLVLAVIGILYGALVALVQPDIKKLVAYSSVSHMGFVVLGIFALNSTATSAGVVQMVNHGLSTGALFLLIGFLYDRRHTREISAFGGLAKQVPVYAGFFLLVVLSSLALPGLNGFVGEFPVLLGTFQEVPWAAVLGSFGAVLAALYLLWAYQRMFHGPLVGAANESTTDLTAREIGVMVPLVVLIVAIGVYPQPLYDLVEPAVDTVLVGVTQ
ncbi:NADH-quinone oxidoreductase subunit M [Salsipaludibacter albus]|uniref:NADH-quinone oxidoreductase subunit M n=1 Tax=Salsipaludibacter albus TaxID=2849650 RepID=UPI001EE47C6D|nr:NADH-quinone oxidoreductase subunit M [Salsipaludibacter albus]MBY5161047.1 NADH-quinone oxidoreductase subunit M [Salsipaludibacter albus]